MRVESKPAKTSRRKFAGLVAAATLAATVLGAAAGHAAEKNPPFVIGVSNDSVANPFRVQMINEIKYYASKHPELIKELVVLNAGEDTNKQISDVQDLISRGVDAIVLSPHSNTAFASVLKDAKDNNIPVATYNNNITEGADLLVAQVTPPFKEWQRQTTEWLAKAMGGKGNVIVLRGITGTPVDGYEWDGAKEVLDQNPGIKVICSEYANWDYGAAKTAVQNCLANHPAVNGILSFGDSMTWAAGEVMAAQGYDITKIPMIGVGGGNGPLKWWAANPKISGLYHRRPYRRRGLRHPGRDQRVDRQDRRESRNSDQGRYLRDPQGLRPTRSAGQCLASRHPIAARGAEEAGDPVARAPALIET